MSLNYRLLTTHTTSQHDKQTEVIQKKKRGKKVLNLDISKHKTDISTNNLIQIFVCLTIT